MILFVADTLYAAFWEALDGLGLGWSFAEGAADRHSWTGLMMRLLALGISIGGTLITALLLGLTSGKPTHLHTHRLLFHFQMCLGGSLGGLPCLLLGLMPGTHALLQQEKYWFRM